MSGKPQYGRYCAAAAIALIVGAAMMGLASADTPIPLRKATPYFPIEAKAQLEGGDVAAQATVDEDGDVKHVKILSEAPGGMGFSTAAMDALFSWTFRPGHPGRYTTKFHFTLDPDLKGIVKAPEPVHQPNPNYPPRAARDLEGGSALLIADLAADGTVVRTEIYQEVPSNYGFGAAASDAVAHWRFPPGTAGRYLVMVDFRLR